MIECVRFKSYVKDTLLGFADIHVHKWGVIIPDFVLRQKDGKRWVQFPGEKYEKEGVQKTKPFMRFIESSHWEAFCNQIKQAIDRYCAEHADD